MNVLTGIVVFLLISLIFVLMLVSIWYQITGKNNLNPEDIELLNPLDSLHQKRSEYEERLKIYYNTNRPRVYLKNSNCELRLIKNNENVSLYCKERSQGNQKGRYFEIKGNSEHATSMWAIYDMEFNESTDYDTLKDIYYSINSFVYMVEPLFKKYPNYNQNSVQNEYCRLELRDINYNQSVIVCSAIWSKTTKEFVIKGDKFVLSKLLSDFKKDKNKFIGYAELLAMYKKQRNLKIEVINEKGIDEKQTGKDTQIIQEEQPNSQKEIVQNTDFIPKNDERSVDL